MDLNLSLPRLREGIPRGIVTPQSLKSQPTMPGSYPGYTYSKPQTDYGFISYIFGLELITFLHFATYILVMGSDLKLAISQPFIGRFGWDWAH